jgi:hypothetical protein
MPPNVLPAKVIPARTGGRRSPGRRRAERGVTQQRDAAPAPARCANLPESIEIHRRADPSDLRRAVAPGADRQHGAPRNRRTGSPRRRRGSARRFDLVARGWRRPVGKWCPALRQRRRTLRLLASTKSASLRSRLSRWRAVADFGHRYPAGGRDAMAGQRAHRAGAHRPVPLRVDDDVAASSGARDRGDRRRRFLAAGQAGCRRDVLIAGHT